MRLRTRIPPRARCSLLALPEEVVLLILKRLTANELMGLRMVSIQHKLWLFSLKPKVFSLLSLNFQGCATVGKSSLTDAPVGLWPLIVRFVADFILKFSAFSGVFKIKAAYWWFIQSMGISIFSRGLAVTQKSASSSKVCCWLFDVTEFSWFARHSNFPPFPYLKRLSQLTHEFCLIKVL